MNYSETINNLVKDDIIRDDGFVNVTELCKIGGKEYYNWRRSFKTQPYIDKISELYNLGEDKLIDRAIGGYYITWAHPTIATNIAQWISVEFSAQVAKWIEEWKENKENKDRYNYELQNIKPDDPYSYREKEIQERLYNELGGVKEYETNNGRVDLLTDNEIIEIKLHDNWKHGIGQLLVYNEDIMNRKMRLHLFDGEYDERIKNICGKYNIDVTWEIV